MTEGVVRAPSSEGATGRLFRRIRGPVDLLFVDPAASGELLAARIRVHVAGFMVLLRLLPGWPSGTNPFQILLGVVFFAWAAALRSTAANRYRPWLGYATSIVDVSCVTLSLVLAAVDDPTLVLRSFVGFPLYFVAIGTSSLKMNWRISAVAGAIAVGQYGCLILAIAASPISWSSWTPQLGRLGTLAVASYIGTATVLRAQQLRDFSTTDFLTGLANRAALDGRLAAELSRAARHRRHFALSLVDVDHFKRFNDTHGHPHGDLLLRGLADVLKSTVRESDLVARYGGEEFAILLAETGAVEAWAKIETLRRLVEATAFAPGARGHAYRLTLSAGVASFPEDATSVEGLLAVADQRLYIAKRAGRNRVEWRSS